MENRIKEMRQKNNLTLKKLGAELNIRDNTLSRYENGRTPNEEILKKIADYFKVPAPYIQGYGWSQKKAVETLAFIYATHTEYYRDYYCEDYNCEYGKVYKYDKGIIKDLDNDSYAISAAAYNAGITNCDSSDFFIDGIPIVDSFSDADREEINNYLEDNEESISVYDILNMIFTYDEKKAIAKHKVIPESEYYSKYLETFKEIAIKRLPTLSNYSFLSTIEMNIFNSGIYGGYELIQEIISNQTTVPSVKDGASSKQLTEFMEQSKRISNSDIDKVLKFMKTLPDKHKLK